jgi:hypothetical protein
LRSDVKYAPYVVYGPPGTGKTKTLVEMIKQACIKKMATTMEKDPRTGQSVHVSKPIRILACAPSNAAADVLARRYGPCTQCDMMCSCPSACLSADVQIILNLQMKWKVCFH